MIRKSQWAAGKLHHAQVCASYDEAARLARGVNNRSNSEVAKAFRRTVKAGRAAVDVGVLVVRARVATS